MLLTTQDRFDDHTIQKTLGLVRGNTIRAKHIGKDIVAGLRTIIGGEIREYSKMLSESREEAIERMTKNAEALGADGIVGIRFTTSNVIQGAAELLAYGTAVKLKRKTTRD